MKKLISYGIGKDYLPHWTVKEALREIFQNYIDYGEYTIETKGTKLIKVTITNDYIPTNLEFLRIGNSKKDGNNAIGKWGEGLKMAFLVMLRNGLSMTIMTNKWLLKAQWLRDTQIGDVLAISYEPHNLKLTKFITKFDVDIETYDSYIQDIIKLSDILYSHSYYGDIVDKPVGNLYCGKLFVCHVDNLSNAYNLRPEVLPLNRDRVLPSSWDINYNTSKLNQAYDKWSTRDLSHNDTMYIDKIPERLEVNFTPKRVGNSIETVVTHDDGTQEVVKHDYVRSAANGLTSFVKKLNIIRKWMSRHKDGKLRAIEYVEGLRDYLSNTQRNELIELIKEI